MIFFLILERDNFKIEKMKLKNKFLSIQYQKPYKPKLQVPHEYFQLSYFTAPPLTSYIHSASDRDIPNL